MFPHEFQARANKQREAQRMERLQWQVWSQVANEWLAHMSCGRRFTVRIDIAGNNWLHLGGAQFGKRSPSECMDFVTALGTDQRLHALIGEPLALDLLYFLRSPEAQGLYDLESFNPHFLELSPIL